MKFFVAFYVTIVLFSTVATAQGPLACGDFTRSICLSSKPSCGPGTASNPIPQSPGAPACYAPCCKAQEATFLPAQGPADEEDVGVVCTALCQLEAPACVKAGWAATGGVGCWGCCQPPAYFNDLAHPLNKS